MRIAARPDAASSPIVIAPARETTRSADAISSAIGSRYGTTRAFANAVPTYADARVVPRSEEHTSELQSHSDLVCRLLLEKKKKEEYKACVNLKKKLTM